MSESTVPERQYNVLVFGLEKKHLPIPPEPLKTRNFCISFETYGTHRRFQEYDGVIMFQGIFEKFERKTGYSSSYLDHDYDTDELDKRKKEAVLLLRKGGFLCFLLTDPFIDNDGRRDFKATDLAKYHLNYSNFYRKNFQMRVAHVTPVVDEFKRFLESFGAASSYFEYYDKSLDCRALARVNNLHVGLLLDESEYFLPSLVPDARIEVVTEYFELLVDAVTSVHTKLHQTIPEWVAAYKFHEEFQLLQERATLLAQIAKVDIRLDHLNQYKSALIHSGPQLVADVVVILKSGFGIAVDAVDDFREDIKLIDMNGKPVAVCEIKGINRGVNREHINQTDSHRERSGFEANFPAILIANTGIKSARSIAEKDQEIASEQVKHAVHMNILILRTIDLLGLLRLVLFGKLTAQDACSLMLSKVGWLRVLNDEIKVVSGE